MWLYLNRNLNSWANLTSLNFSRWFLTLLKSKEPFFIVFSCLVYKEWES